MHNHSNNPLNCDHVSEACPIEGSIYGYYPSIGANSFFLALFALCLFFNVFFGIRYKTWTYLIAMGFGSLGEVVGYIGRLLLHNNPYGQVGFEMQICCLIISPAFNAAAIYLTLKHVAIAFGPEASRIRPKYYTWIFITFDILALILQGTGGGMAATSNNNNHQLNVGDNLMLTGIAWQVATLLAFGLMFGDYVWRRRASGVPLSKVAIATKNDRKFQIFMVAISIAYLAILIRCVYRIAEMANGWRNPIMQSQGLFIGLDSSMVALASVLQTACHPGIFFPRLSFSFRKSEQEEKSQELDLRLSA